MAVLKASDNSEMIISCKCGCDDGLRIKIEKDEEDYCFMTYLSGNWYKEQAGFIKKLKKIWAIIRNKDFYYSELPILVFNTYHKKVIPLSYFVIAEIPTVSSHEHKNYLLIQKLQTFHLYFLPIL